MKDFLKWTVFAGLFAIPFLTLYVENDYFFPFITGKNFWYRIIIDVTFAAWAVLALMDVKYRPKFSWIAASFGALLVIMFFANLFGEHPRSSFWSNFERMDGYVSLVHTFLYMFMLGSVLKTKQEWKYLLNTSLVVAFFVAFYGLAQYGGLVDGSSRIDSRLGNAAYMAIYMLFHIFISFWLFVESKGLVRKLLYAALAVMFTFVLIETGTRGTAVGLGVGVMVMSAYIGLFGAQFKEYRKYALGGVVLLTVAASLFVTFRDSAVVQSNPNLARIANISIDDLEIRSIIWGMAWEGVQERPLLGWGQSNFNYVFNENYDARLYAQEQWFDRAHNIFMDWLVTGGFLGLFAYLGIFAACAWYLFLRPLLKPEDETFTVLERGILLGILAGYFTHNLVVFDNIVSYMFFATLLGLMHSRVATPIKAVESFKIDESVAQQVAMPVMGAAVVAVIYFVHVPGMQAAGDIIDAFGEPDAMERLEIFERAIERDSFAHQEITEQLSQQSMNLARDPQLPVEVKQAYAEAAEEQLMRLAAEKPGDARIHVFIGSYYRATNDIDKAAEQMSTARELSPNKQAIIIQQGFIELSRNQNEAARDFFREAYELDERNLEAKEYYTASLFYTGQAEEAKALVDSEETAVRFAESDFLIGTANQFGQIDFVIELFETRVNTAPTERQNWQAEAQNWATLSFLYYEQGENEKAVEVLRRSEAFVPSFAPTAQCIVGNIENGREPQEGC